MDLQNSVDRKRNENEIAMKRTKRNEPRRVTSRFVSFRIEVGAPRCDLVSFRAMSNQQNFETVGLRTFVIFGSFPRIEKVCSELSS